MPSDFNEFDQQRLSDLKDNIAEEQQLLKEYEDKLRCEDDPKGQKLCERKIQTLKESIKRHRQEYENLKRGVQGLERSPAQVIECLWSLNYDPQCQNFKCCIPRSRRAAAFVVQAKDSRIQNWLVKRLVNQIPNVDNARVFPFLVPMHPMWKRHDFNELWVDLAGRLRCEKNSASVIDELVRAYQTQPIIFAMYGWSATERSRSLQQEVLQYLWEPLVAAVGDLQTQPVRSRLILFLAEGNDTVSGTVGESTSENLGSINPAVPIRLAPLAEITSDHVADWMDSQEVKPLLRQFLSEEKLDTLISEEIVAWSPDPVETIEQICYVFELANGIAELETAWRLAG